MKQLTEEPILITNPANIRYLTGFVSAAPHAREAYLLLLPSRMVLFTNSLYTQQAKQLIDNPPVERLWHETPMTVSEITIHSTLFEQLRDTLSEETVSNVAIEGRHFTVAEFEKLKAALDGIEIIPKKQSIESLRKIKRNDELDHIRKAVKLTDECFAYTISQIRPGMTEEEVAWMIESFIRSRGAQMAFPAIVAFAENSSMPHYQYTNPKTLSEGDCILLDFGARWRGYCADMTRMAYVGEPSEEFNTAYEVVLEAQQRALSYLETTKQPSGAHADTLARDILTNHQYDEYPHSLGHAVGLDIHERPRLTKFRDETLTEHMVVSVEPGVYIEGKFGIRIEDLVHIRDNGIEILSTSPKTLARIKS